MKFANVVKRGSSSILAGEVLSEAMPWIKEITGKTIVVKYGGAAMVSEDLRKAVMADVLMLKMLGVKPVIVHGGGNAISAQMKKEGLEVEFIDGQRVTNDEAMRVVRNVLTGEVNQQLVWEMNQHGNIAVGISGADAGVLIAKQRDEKLGRIGEITRVNPGLILDLVEDDYIPLVSTVALGEDGGIFNVNADVAAGHIAGAIGAHKVIFISDVDGIYKDFPDEDSLIANMNIEEAKELTCDPNISSGMIPKLQSCIHALEAGVPSVQFVNGTTPHGLLIELLTDNGIGTLVSNTGDVQADHHAEVDHFASRLLENRYL